MALQSVQRVLSRATTRVRARPFSPLLGDGSDYSPCSSKGTRSPSEFVTPRVDKMTSRMRSKVSPAWDASGGESQRPAELENERSWEARDWNRNGVSSAEDRPGSVRRDKPCSVRNEGHEKRFADEDEEKTGDQRTSRSEQMASPKQVEDWELIAEMTRLDSLLSPDAGKRRSDKVRSPIETATPGPVTGGKERRGLGAVSRELESPQESISGRTPPTGRFSREPSRSPRNPTRARRARPRRATAVEAMESLNREFEDVFSRIEQESPRKGGPVLGAGEGSAGAVEGQSGGEREKQGLQSLEGTVRAVSEAAERDPLSEDRNRDGKKGRGGESEGNGSSVPVGGGAYVGRTVQLHRNSSTIRRSAKSQGGTAGLGATPQRDQRKGELRSEMEQKVAGSFTPGTRGSSRLGSPSRMVSISGNEKPNHGRTHRLERSYGEIGGPGDSPRSGGDTPGGAKISAKKGGGALRESRLGSGQTMRSSIDKLDRRRIEDLTSSVIASVAERKRREEKERETAEEINREVEKEKVEIESPHAQTRDELASPQSQAKANAVSSRKPEERIEHRQEVKALQNRTAMKSPEVAPSPYKGHLEVAGPGNKKQSPEEAEEVPREAGDYCALLELLQRERQKRAETEGREAELERELLENSTSYSLKVKQAENLFLLSLYFTTLIFLS